MQMRLWHPLFLGGHHLTGHPTILILFLGLNFGLNFGFHYILSIPTWSPQLTGHPTILFLFLGLLGEFRKLPFSRKDMNSLSKELLRELW